MLFTSLIHSTTSIQGKFKNLLIDENNTSQYQPKGRIICIESNYGINTTDGYNPKKIQKKNTKGRKKNIKIYKRKRQGNGTQFNSQIQFHIRPENKIEGKEDKIYKIKCFRKETFNVPGVLLYDWRDVMPVLNELCQYHRDINSNPNIKIENVYPFLVNFKCRLKNENLLIILNNIVKRLESYKTDQSERKEIIEILDNSPISKTLKNSIMKHMPINRLSMTEIKYESERFPSGITVKFIRPNVRIKKDSDYEAKSTIKIFKSGKINFDHSQTIEQADDLYYWLNDFIKKNIKYVIYDKDNIVSDDSSCSSDSDDYNN